MVRTGLRLTAVGRSGFRRRRNRIMECTLQAEAVTTMTDVVLHNGTIHTMDPRQPLVNWLMIRQEQVVARGMGDRPSGCAEAGTLHVDLQGAGVVPGMIDGHLHFESLARKAQQLDPETSTLEELVARVADQARRQTSGTWILGFGWNQNVWGGQFPDRTALDAAAPGHPVFLRAKSGHAGWANSMALRLAGVGPSTAAPEGGEILFDSRGEPTGILLESAQDLVAAAIPEPTLADTVAAMRDAQRLALSVGLTGVHDLDGRRALQAWQVLRQSGDLHLRVTKSIPGSLLGHALAVGLRDGLGDDWLRLSGVKLFVDGALGPRTAWMLEPYEREPDNLGMALVDPLELREQVLQASAAGWPLLIHAIGDRANREALEALEAAREQEGERAGGIRLRHRIEHVQVLDAADLPRLAALDIIASVQPLHATSDMEIVDRHWGARGAGAYAFRALAQSGTRLIFGSDAPVETLAPLAGIHAAVTRRRTDGSPGDQGWYPGQRLGVHTALHAYTAGAAYALGDDARRGMLAPGQLADLVVLDADLYRIPAMEIPGVSVLGTMVGGQWRYQADGGVLSASRRSMSQ